MKNDNLWINLILIICVSLLINKALDIKEEQILVKAGCSLIQKDK